ncbi:MAG: biopolymer transporter ExbD [Bacteroidales bacterium]|nr:biopolymer transporter ExbD [Bacteroidales bacterium]MBR5716125.1 biopolymer transporter ExbD [Bacteroidales bacterium]
MAKKKRKAPSINSSSSADLAFTLLIFFLVVTSMDTDEGLARLLPRWVPEDQIQDQEIKKRNILNVMVNKDNAILMGDDYIEGSVEKQNEQIRKKAIEFITATGQFAGDRGPEMKEVDPEKSPELQKLIVAKDPTVRVAKSHVISLQSDYGTSYEKYIQLQNELVAAYNTLRQEAAQKYFQKDYDEEVLSQDEAKALKDLYPMNISEANAKY